MAEVMTKQGLLPYQKIEPPVSSFSDIIGKNGYTMIGNIQSLTDKPTDVNGNYGMVEIISNGSAHCLLRLTTVTNKTYAKYYVNPNWTEWKEL